MPRVNIGKPTPNNVLLSNISKYMTLRCMDKKDLAPATGSMTTLNSTVEALFGGATPEERSKNEHDNRGV